MSHWHRAPKGWQSSATTKSKKKKNEEKNPAQNWGSQQLGNISQPDKIEASRHEQKDESNLLTSYWRVWKRLTAYIWLEKQFTDCLDAMEVDPAENVSQRPSMALFKTPSVLVRALLTNERKSNILVSRILAARKRSRATAAENILQSCKAQPSRNLCQVPLLCSKWMCRARS